MNVLGPRLILNLGPQRNMLKCFKAAAEKEYSRSEYPFNYCYGYNSKETDSHAYAICVPSPCEPDHFMLLNVWKQASSGFTSNTTMIDKSLCVRSRHQKEWYLKVIPVASLSSILFLLLIVSLATIYHFQRGTKTKALAIKIFLAFSAKKNLAKLCQMPIDGQSTIKCMFGIRFLTIVWIVIGHSFAWIEPYIGNPAEYRRDIVDNFYNQWISNFLLTVDTFLVLGGTVNAYGFFRKIQRMSKDKVLRRNFDLLIKRRKKPSWSSYGYWLRFYRHRIVRLWPAYLYTLLGVMFLSSSYYHAMWPELDPVVQCSEHWWENLLFISSLFENRCMGWTWYIGTEFIFYLMSPIFLLTLMHSRNIGLMLCVVTTLASAALRGIAMIVYNLPPTQLGWNTPPVFNANYMQHFSQMYIKPHYRIGPYIIGLILGYHLAELRNSAIDRSRKLIAMGWTLSTFAGLLSVYGLYPILRGWNWPVYYIIYGAFHRTLFALAIAWIIFACHCGYGNIINRFLSHSVFIPLSALCYSVYLSHMPVIFATFLQLPFPYEYTGKIPIILHCIIRLILSYALGLQCSLLSELPAVNIERVLLGRNEPVKRAQQNNYVLSSMPSTRVVNDPQ
ncbi:unnamed protein product [Toxocara canis]|uniref:Acyl_transf_3 domain-containing protein n=1 Tax=Toxocara canis TaxID=6265 RepID=A0A183V2J4_TOXCA|nr:unnamed protein product [Toxocara canis]